MSEARSSTAGPLAGVRVVDISALAPGPFATMILADFGAEVIAVERPGGDGFGTRQWLGRGKRFLTVDLRRPEGVAVVSRLARDADVFVEGFRPGTAERLGLGPEVLLEANPGLVYARVSGWGQDGPYATRAGHDINYIAVAGALGVIGRDDPVPPANLVGDFAGGSLFAVIGVLLALQERQRSGRGQVVDAAMVDGAALLVTGQLGLAAAGRWGRRGTNLLDGSAPFYATYACADGRYVAVGAIEEPFWQALLDGLGLAGDAAFDDRMDPANWPPQRAKLAQVFADRPRDEWVKLLGASDACLTPVLELDELEHDDHLTARGTIERRNGALQAAPAPRLSRTPGAAGPPALPPGTDAGAVLAAAGFRADEVEELRRTGVLAG
ncbi:MAG TPA: CaiB/BaiF CoA-transferase family protein [Acidimicrobiia bacterium]|nr:CaiB/BaiF CoA-transferase family protein [Acidimicrobiia bacterium]